MIPRDSDDEVPATRRMTPTEAKHRAALAVPPRPRGMALFKEIAPEVAAPPSGLRREVVEDALAEVLLEKERTPPAAVPAPSAPRMRGSFLGGPNVRPPAPRKRSERQKRYGVAPPRLPGVDTPEAMAKAALRLGAAINRAKGEERAAKRAKEQAPAPIPGEVLRQITAIPKPPPIRR